MFNGATDSFTKLERKHLSIGFSIFISLTCKWLVCYDWSNIVYYFFCIANYRAI